MCQIGALKKLSHHDGSPWAAAALCQPKKAGGARALAGLRELSKRIQRKPFPLPRAMEPLQKIERLKPAAAIGLPQGYYHIPISERAQKLCAAALPWGKHACRKLAMGIASAPGISQPAMSDALGGLGFALAYLGDVLCLQRSARQKKST